MDKNEIKNLIKDILDKANLEVLEIDHAKEDLFGPYGFSLNVKDYPLFLDRGGEGVSALNHIVRRIVENKYTNKEEQNEGENNERAFINVIVDINDFQKKKIETVRSVAHMMAERARYFKSNIEMDPMSSFERRVIHEFLSEEEDLDTESQGFGRDRRVVIKYKGGI
ncbi:MAG: hypothetical protein K9L98_00090 [Candidatus Pacebacteria bacterium]|nr:hypothetical protein [Candidatus Paceibacterota bacterium]MCF7862403.1 hypothetical protein [Candidatus Paceibacterota bacterium]